MRLEGDTEDVGVFFMLLYKTSFAKKYSRLQFHDVDTIRSIGRCPSYLFMNDATRGFS